MSGKEGRDDNTQPTEQVGHGLTPAANKQKTAPEEGLLEISGEQGVKPEELEITGERGVKPEELEITGERGVKPEELEITGEKVKTFTGHPPNRTYPSVTQTRLGSERIISSVSGNVLAQSADLGFLPQYAKRVAEYSQNNFPPGITTEHIKKGISALQELYQNAQSDKEKIEAVNKMYDTLREEIAKELGDEAAKQLVQYVRNLVHQQFGQDETNLRRVGVDYLSKANWHANERSLGGWGWRTNRDPAEELLMAIDMMQSAVFFAPLSVQQNGTNFSINNGSTKLVEGEVNKENQTMKFELAEGLEGDDLEKAVNALADIVSSHRQQRDNRVRITSVHENPEVTIRYLEVLLCQKYMHLDISAIAQELEHQVANNPALQERLNFVKEFMQIMNPADNKFALTRPGVLKTGPRNLPDFFNAEVKKLPDLTKYGFKEEQFSNKKDYRACLEYLFQQRLGHAQSPGQDAKATPSASFEQQQPPTKPSASFQSKPH